MPLLAVLTILYNEHCNSELFISQALITLHAFLRYGKFVLHTSFRLFQNDVITEGASNTNVSYFLKWATFAVAVALYRLSADIFLSQRIHTRVSFDFHIVIDQQRECHSVHQNLGFEVARDFVSKSHAFVLLASLAIAENIDTDWPF